MIDIPLGIFEAVEFGTYEVDVVCEPYYGKRPFFRFKINGNEKLFMINPKNNIITGDIVSYTSDGIQILYSKNKISRYWKAFTDDKYKNKM